MVSPDNPMPNRTEDAMPREEAFRFHDGDADLAGLLVSPSGQGPHPAVVFIHGAGPENRDGGGLYRLIWKRFTERGFACISWDKPGIGQSTGDSGDWRRQDYQQRAKESLAALHSLQARQDIDGSRIGFWGMSEGGLVCALAATLDKDVAFVIPVSSPVGSLIERELFATEAEMRAEKATEEAIRSARDVVSREMQLISNGTSLEEVIAASKAVETEPWFKTFEYINWSETWTLDLYDIVRRHIAFDSLSVLEGVKCPVLAIWGQLDSTVPAERSCEIFRECLARSGNRDVTTRIFPKADHALLPTVTGGMREMLKNWVRQQGFVPGYLETMADWLTERFLPDADAPCRFTQH